MNRRQWLLLWEQPTPLLWAESTTDIFEKDSPFKHLETCRNDFALYAAKNGFMGAHHIKEEVDAFPQWGKEMHDKPGYVKEVVKEALKNDQDSRNYALKIKQADLTGLVNEELAVLYGEYYELMQGSQAYYKFSNDQFQEIIANELKQFFTGQNLTESEAREIVSELTTPEILSTLDKHELDLLEIAHEIVSNNFSLETLPQNITDRIDRHVETYGVIGTGEGGDFWDRNHTISSIKDLAQLREDELAARILNKKNKTENILQRRGELISKYNVPDQHVTYIEQIIALAETKLELRIGWAFREYYVKALLEEIGERLDLTSDEVFLFRKQEAIDALIGASALSKEKLADRQKAYAFLVLDGKLHFYEGDEAIKKVDEEVAQEDFSEIIELKGSIAKAGHVTGTAKIISPLQDQAEAISRVQEGDILITGMTRPHMLPAMKKAVAYVTDEGGITCHAAIIARELGKPCVIATKIATKVFKDGDTVEVDANTGIVRKLKGV